MRSLSLLLVTAGALVACAGDDPKTGAAEANATSEGAPTADTNFHARGACEDFAGITSFKAEIDLSDHRSPQYRLRHLSGYPETLEHQQIVVRLRDGSEWESKDLQSKSSIMDAKSDENDRWYPLPIPQEFMDKAFQVKPGNLYNLKEWEITYWRASPSFPFGLPDEEACGGVFYGEPSPLLND